jgi:hypothetical protein
MEKGIAFSQYISYTVVEKMQLSTLQINLRPVKAKTAALSLKI